jgi:hypothetical protein
MKRRLAIFAGLGIVAVLSSAAIAQAADSWVGTWKPNLEKSTYSPGPKPTTPPTIKLEAPEGGIKITVDGTNPQGQPTHVEINAKFDGKDYPVVGSPTPNSTDSVKRINARTIEIMGKVDGKPSVTTRISISADGKTLTANQTGTNPQGQAVKNMIVAEKQ